MSNSNTNPSVHSLHTQIFVQFAPDQDACPVDIIATSAQELKECVATLLGSEEVAPAKKTRAKKAKEEPAAEEPAGTEAPKPETQPQTAAQPTPSQAQPDTAQTATATNSATTTDAQPKVEEVSAAQVLNPARQLLKTKGGEETLKSILATYGAASISTADPAHFADIKADIEASI